MSEATKRTIIEDGTEIEGSVKSKCDVAVSGKVKGSVVAPALMISRSGSVDGKVSVSDLNSQGTVSGKIEATTVELAGAVGDDTVVRAKTLEVKLSDPKGNMQVSFGNCSLQVGQKFGFSEVKQQKETQVNQNVVVRSEEKEPVR